ncbi:hypothetical protein J3Q64DRAFT_1719539 [Phycomyces blakesleeanus]|uniref:Stc1 domain-containing protein n=2 Tax=Phycomyces blakesleeanus TaxID=4837 RepID=A0A167PSV8_PHYB8|nr:hypothetical protein PHYBLDRAFT_62758 [Phycomyces blakesleeanus NRRL 1555(-)]OAD78478.1 hypothetical protein PHYBLDRAFT_62758 [Phycomyces blakesleeanus NRRL 1555(-)]|eukprot:XP_018296518.1 hypothetical protein PHYBLDRAFT_62758 [Phycomyces blakesleeanus NRRL 1555(-)]
MSRQGPAGKFRIQPAFQDGYGTQGANDQSPKLKSLRCVFCSIDKPLDAFSQTQIQKATFNPYAPPSYNKGTKAKQISCKQCTASVNSTLTCMTCTKTKPLESFAKVQRKHAEKARCLKCMKKREEEDLDDSEYDSDDDSDPYGPM